MINPHLPPARGFYTASKTAHATLWRTLRGEGHPILSSWIDEAGPGETACFIDLWDRCVGEAKDAACTILYRLPGETLKGALVEAGAALAAGRTVLFVGDADGLGSFLNHRNAETCESMAHALQRAQSIIDAIPSVSTSPEGARYRDMTAPQMLEVLGTDASKWADAFREHFPEMDHDVMLGWFANAMMAMWDRTNAGITHDDTALADHISALVRNRDFWRELQRPRPGEAQAA